ncbi:MAG: acetyl-CoA acetyltransferase [Candidatus Handelsmanbacteria bacterium RIFCSPLOWO2_12_FULL_64_10]|uniref:acetyl-CoA C-acetyltransferase n=1 Tax=Handelsmanbacteria sp. (strain RIFCSPLOWO2_12_FULL_64_10) TaxID=1817868 RepID=A0A1F6CC57_HANXR|nr:MAG: acetyl-CoA acetyltransferase [Candidatus Handelsmanbacteria bacterium RIFCSPLOWO2_12_FULL_64_10]
MSDLNVVIASACRTPIGSFMGALSPLTAPQLGSVVIREALRRAGLEGEDVSEVVMGEVLTAGVGQAPARQAALGAGIPDAVPCTTINKVCGSGLKAVMLAAQAIQTGDAEVVVAGGMESMSNAPYLLDRARSGYRLGHGALTDSLIRDGLWDVYNDFHMGDAAERCARECRISREAQDEFALQSYRKALAAQERGYFRDEIAPVTVEGRKGPAVVSEDEEPRRADFDKIPLLKPAFQKDGAVTVANASSLSDGAAACVVMSGARARALGVEPLARVVAQASAAREPAWFTLAPAKVIPRVLERASLSLSDIDLFEINEAFAVVNLAVGRALGLDTDRLNVHGGAVALGHPIGASGARILVTLLYALKRYDKRRGLAALCIGGGEASALVVER